MTNPVLDLKAVEAEAQHVEAGIYPARAVMLAEKTLALLSILRETRAALEEVLSDYCSHFATDEVRAECWQDVRDQAAAVLAKVKDD